MVEVVVLSAPAHLEEGVGGLDDATVGRRHPGTAQVNLGRQQHACATTTKTGRGGKTGSNNGSETGSTSALHLLGLSAARG